MAIWTFDALAGIVSGTSIPATAEDVDGIPDLQMFNQVIDDNGKNGVAYTDIEGTLWPSTRAISWDDVRGGGADAELWITMNTTGWEDITMRFDYIVDSDRNGSFKNFTLQYSTDGGANFTNITILALIDDNTFHMSSTDMSAIAVIEDAGLVIFRIIVEDDNTNDELTLDNIEFYGTKLAVCPGIAPTIEVDQATTTDFINLPTSSSGALSGVLSDPTDPAQTIGIDFDLTDDGPLGSLTVTVVSSNQAVVPDANLVLTGIDGDRNLTITPISVGFADITLTVSDGVCTDTYIIQYAASTSSTTPATSRYHTSLADASSAVAIDANYMFVANDEDQTIRLFDRYNSGAPLASFNFTSNLNLTDLSGGVPREVDIEASAMVGNTIYWLASHSNSSSGDDRPNRERLFTTTVSGAGANSVLTFGAYYEFLKDDLIAWDNANGHGLGAGFLGLQASATIGVTPETVGGFNIEGLAMAPDNTTGYIAFRAPLQDPGTRNMALIIPVTNFTTLPGSAMGSSTFGAPILMDLGGRGIRSIDKNANNEYLIIAGPATSGQNFAMYSWDGVPANPPLLITTAQNLPLISSETDGSFETIVEVPTPLVSGSVVQIVLDMGDEILYNNGVLNKDLSQGNWKKVRSDLITLTTVLPVELVAFEGESTTKGVALTWETATELNNKGFEIQRAAHKNTKEWENLGFVAGHGTTIHANFYTFLDKNPIEGVNYYRLKQLDTDGAFTYSDIVAVLWSGDKAVVVDAIYPNPAATEIVQIPLYLAKEATISVELFDLSGKRLRNQLQTLASGTTSLAMSIHDLPAGMYMVNIQSNGLNQTQRLVVTR